MIAILRKQNQSLIVTKNGEDYKVRLDQRFNFLALHAVLNNDSIDYEKLAQGVNIPGERVYLALHRPSKRYFAVLTPEVL